MPNEATNSFVAIVDPKPLREHEPYPGLRPFRSDESDIFFGRETQTDEMVRRLKTSRFLAVVGTSGCGKSSLVRAGLIAALETGLMGIPEGARWKFAVTRPGSKPMVRLAAKLFEQIGTAAKGAEREIGLGLLGARLRRGPLGLLEVLQANPLPDKTNLLVAVDQFEEIFRFRREGDLNEADAFVALLLASAEQSEFPVFVVLTMRSDFIGDCAVFDGLPEAINESQYLTPRLSREQRRLAIIGPARSAGGDVADNLVTRLLNETGSGPDQLPVLQHLLMRMWTSKARSNAAGQRIVLTMEDYDRVGGLEHALSNHADEIYDRLAGDAERGIAEVMFRRLSESPTDIRRPTEAGEIVRIAGMPVESVAAVADAFRAPGANFLMPEPGEAIEAKTKLDISHESLIKRWQRLRAWASNEARVAESYRDLERTAQGHRRGEKGLLIGLDLQQALLWRRRYAPSAEWAARYGGDFDLAMAFLAESERAAERRRQEEEAKRRKTLLWWRVAAVVCFTLFVSSVVFGRFAVVKQREAAEHQARAIAAQARNALDIGDSRIAVLAALDALPALGMRGGDLTDWLRSPIDPTMVPSLRAAFDAVARAPLDAARYPTLAKALWNALRSPLDAQLYRSVADLLFRPLQEDAIDALEQGVYRPFGRIFDSKGGSEPVIALAVSNAARMLVTATHNGVRRWQWTDKDTWEERPIIEPTVLTRPVDVAATASGSALLRADPADVPPAVGPSPGTEPSQSVRMQRVRQDVSGMALSADGRWLATMTDYDQVTIWDAVTGKEMVSWFANRRRALPEHETGGGVIAIAADPARAGYQRLITASRTAGDALIWSWDATDPSRKPDGPMVLEDPGRSEQPRGRRSHSKSIMTLVWSVDGRRAVTGSWDGTAKVWDAPTGDLLYILDSGKPVRSARFSPQNNDRLVTAHNDGKLRLWCTQPSGTASHADAESTGGQDGWADVSHRPPTPCVPITAATPKTGNPPLGRLRARPALVVTLRPTPWDTLSTEDEEEGSRPLMDIDGSRGPVAAVFDPQGERIVSAGADGAVRLWDIKSGTIVDVMQGPLRAGGRNVSVEFFDEQRLAASFSDGRAFLWTLGSTPLRPRSLPAISDVKTAAIDDQGRRLAVATSERTANGVVERIQIWNLTPALTKPVRTLQVGAEPVKRLAFSLDGRLLLVVAGSSVRGWNANLWRGGDDAPLWTLLHPAAVVDAAFDAGGKRLATASMDGAVRVWDLRNGTISRVLEHGAPVLALAFNADDDRLATLTDDGTARVWNFEDGAQLALVGGLPAAVGRAAETTTIRFDARDDGLYVVRGLDSGKPQAWSVSLSGALPKADEGWMINTRHRAQVRPSGSIEITTEKESLHPFAQIPPFRDPLRSIVVSQDGDYLAAFYAKGQVRVMQLPESDPMLFIRYVRARILPMLEKAKLDDEERRRLGLDG